MKKLTNIQKVEQYDLKNPNATARQAGADLDMSPNQVYQIRWNLRNRKAKIDKKITLVSEGKNISNTIDEWEGTKSGFPSAPVKNEGASIHTVSEQIARKIHDLQMKVEEQRIIIKYLEQRLYEEKADGS